MIKCLKLNLKGSPSFCSGPFFWKLDLVQLRIEQTIPRLVRLMGNFLVLKKVIVSWRD